MGGTCSTDTTSNQYETDPTVYEVVDDFSIVGNVSEVQNHTLKPPSDDYELTTIILHTCFDEDKKVDVFNGIELEWTHSATQETYQSKVLGSQLSNDTIMYEVSHLDYIERIVWNQHDAIKAQFLTHFGLVPKMGKTQEVGTKGCRTRALQNNTSTEVQSELQGLELSQLTTDKQYFVSVKAIWKDLPESKRVTNPEAALSFFEYNRNLNLRLLDKQKAYLYKNYQEIYSEFEALINPKNGTQEYLGALPVRFLSPEEKTRLDNAISESNASNLLAQLQTRKRFYGQLLPADIKKEIVDFCVQLINKELQKTSSTLDLEEIADNIRFLNKIFTGIYNEDQELWTEVKTATAESLAQFNSLIFKDVISEMIPAPQEEATRPQEYPMQVVQDIEDYFNEDYNAYQKNCPQAVDKGTVTDTDLLIEEYIKEARQILVEFHGTMRFYFGASYAGEPVAEAGKVKARVQEFIEQDLPVSDAVARIMDFVKGTIVCSNGEELADSYNKLRELCTTHGFTVVRVDNQFKELETETYKAIVVNIMAYDCLICEVQLTLASMINIKEVSQFISSLQREKSLYAIVSDYLSHYHQFNNWLAPFLPESRVLLMPEKNIRFKGFFYYKGADQYSKRGYMDMMLCFKQNGVLTGYGVDPLGEYKIEGTHYNYKSITFVKTMVNVPNPWSINYGGEFVDTGVIEGNFLVSTTEGHFRLYVGDYEYPSLNSGLVRINFTDKAKKVLPSREMEWKGHYDQYGAQYLMSLRFTVLPDGSITGNGKDDIDSFTVIGQHDQYKTFSFIKMMDGNSSYGKFSIYYEGFFVDNYVVEGKWNSGGFIGNFHLEVEKDEIQAIENEASN